MSACHWRRRRSDLKLQAEQPRLNSAPATGVLAQASAAEGRAKEPRTKGWSTEAQLDQVKAAGDEARARLNRAERSVELTKNSLSYAHLVADTRGVVTATLIEPGQVVASGRLRSAWRGPPRRKPSSRFRKPWSALPRQAKPA